MQIMARGDAKSEAAILTAYEHEGGQMPDVLKRLATLEAAAGQETEAIATLERINYIYPVKDDDLHRTLGDLLYAQKQYDAAIREYNAVIACNPVDKAGAEFDLAQAYFAAGQKDKAEDSVLAALETAPDYRPAQKLLLELQKPSRKIELREEKGNQWLRFAGLNQDAALLQQRIEHFHGVREEILKQVREVIVGQEEVLDQILIALFVGGHCLLTGMPGTAKTLMVRTIADALGLRFRRIQFTPDLMPSDITGTDIIEEDLTTGHRKWTFVEGPIFGNILLADEINRTPPKTQSALLEAMQEHSCTVRGHIYTLPAPFFVLATQNPIELEGTYPLPEAQLDRFLFNAILEDLNAEDELKVIDQTTATRVTNVEAVTNAEEMLEFQQLVRMVPIADTLSRYRDPAGARHAAKERKCAGVCHEVCELRGQRARRPVHCTGRQGARAFA